MSELRVFLLGGVRVLLGPSGAEAALPRSSEALLAYLMLSRNRRHPRDSLCELFWPELPPGRARGALSTTLWRLRRALEGSAPRGTYLSTSPTGEVGFNEGAEYWLDVEVLESHVAATLRERGRGLDAGAAARLATVLDLYTGDLMEGVYDEWVEAERQRVRVLYLDGLSQLLDHYQRSGALDEAMAWGQRILHLEPLSEEVHRRMMELYAASGRRPLALRQYEACRKVLASELGIGPMDETVAVYERLVRGNGCAAEEQSATGDAAERAELDSIRERLHRARESVESALDALEHVEARRAERAGGERSRTTR
ncbi:MAG TPA: BTAD domain-containing putative transcriptional regulator [Actinomycetota bacterium]|nr:BTAD domain-containing putative transcriptional regulator [Actinomycetota bacterium]